MDRIETGSANLFSALKGSILTNVSNACRYYISSSQADIGEILIKTINRCYIYLYVMLYKCH